MKMLSTGWFLMVLTATGCSVMGDYSPLLPLERAMVYQPAGNAAPDEQNDVYFSTADGVRLQGKFFDDAQRRAVILYCHGNAGSLESWAMAAEELARTQHCAVLIFDYRGYGKSEGTPGEAGLLSDARAARKWLAQRTCIAEQEVVLLGRSLGGGVAVDLAARDGARGLILENTFSSLPDVAAIRLPWLLPHWMMTQRFNSIDKLQQYRGPLLQCHGDKDQIIPIKLARQLFDEAPGDKHFITIPGGTHNDPPTPVFIKALGEFLDSLPKVQ